MTPKDELLSVFTHKPISQAQRRASREFQALGSLHRIRAILASLQGTVPDAVLVTLRHASTRGIDHIRATQFNRKKLRLESELVKLQLAQEVFEPTDWIDREKNRSK